MAKRHTFSVTLLPSLAQRKWRRAKKRTAVAVVRETFGERDLSYFIFSLVFEHYSLSHARFFARFLLPSSWYKTLHHPPWNFQLNFPLLNHQWLECNLIRKKCKKSSIQLLEARYSNYFLIYRNDHPAMTSFEGRMSSAFFCIVNYFIFLDWL